MISRESVGFSRNTAGWAAGGAVVIAITVGCGGPPPPRADAVAALEQADSRFAAKDLEAARAGYAEAITLGALRADLHERATLRLAYCEACLENTQAAKALLDELAEVAADMASVHAMRAFVLTQAGDAQAARAELAKARQFDPAARMPAAL
jgi:hypothetical protein